MGSIGIKPGGTWKTGTGNRWLSRDGEGIDSNPHEPGESFGMYRALDQPDEITVDDEITHLDFTTEYLLNILDNASTFTFRRILVRRHPCVPFPSLLFYAINFLDGFVGICNLIKSFFLESVYD